MESKLCIVLNEIKRQRGCADDQVLARVLGVSPSTVSHYRSGSRGVSLYRIDVMAELLEVDPYELHVFLKGGNSAKVPGTEETVAENVFGASTHPFHPQPAAGVASQRAAKCGV